MNKIREALEQSSRESEGQNNKGRIEKKALGRGLASLIGSQDADTYKRPVSIFEKVHTDQGSIQYLDTHLISAGEYQPREDFNDLKLKELIDSIKEKGVLQPILVRKAGSGFEIIAGERRYRASCALGIKKIPVIVREVDDKEALVISLIENIQRQELNAIEEAQAYQQLLEKFFFSQDAIAKSLGKDKTTISNGLRLLKLPSTIQQSVVKGQISAGHAKVLLSIEDKKTQNKLFQLSIRKSLSVRELENIISSGGKKRKRRISDDVSADPYVFNCERKLQLALGTKVRLLAQRKRGKITIEYYSPEDLERIVGIITKK